MRETIKKILKVHGAFRYTVPSITDEERNKLLDSLVDSLETLQNERELRMWVAFGNFCKAMNKIKEEQK